MLFKETDTFFLSRMTNKRITNGYCLRTPHDRCCSFTLKKYILRLSWEGESIELVLKTTGCKYFESLLVMADQTVLYKNDSRHLDLKLLHEQGSVNTVMCRYINIMGHSVQYFCLLKKCKKIVLFLSPVHLYHNKLN